MSENATRAALALALEMLKHPENASTRLVFADALDEAGFAEEAADQRSTAMSELRKWKGLLTERWEEEAMSRRNREMGHHWFSSDTKRFFGSRIGQIFQGPGGVYFVSSERDFNGCGRQYSVRRFDLITGWVEAIGEFGSWGSSRAANREAERLARAEPSDEVQKLAALLNSLQL